MNNNLKESALHYLSSPAFNKNTLVDITEIHVRSEPDGDKMKAFVDAVKNPYLFRVGSIGVHVTYQEIQGILYSAVSITCSFRRIDFADSYDIISACSIAISYGLIVGGLYGIQKPI